MNQPPTVAQLRNLADRADRGPLRPIEVTRLRQGIDRLAARPRTHPAASWANRVRALRRKLHTLHAPIQRGGVPICGHCSGWNGSRVLGLLTEWPCDTVTLFDSAFPVTEQPGPA